MASALAIGIRTESSLATVSPGSGQISAPAATVSKRGAYTPFHNVFFLQATGCSIFLDPTVHGIFVNMKV